MRILRIATVVLVGAGCAGSEDLVTSKTEGAGTAAEYPVPADQAFDICVAIFRWDGAAAIEEHREQGYVFVGRSGAFVEEGAARGWTRVTVVARNADFSEAGFHQDFRRALRLVQAGRPLPDARPVNEAR